MMSSLIRPNAAFSTYQNKMPGATEITVYDKVANIINVAEFGVVGDGITDVADNLQRCFDSRKNPAPLTSGHGYFPTVFVFPYSDQPYVIGKTITLPENCVIDFQGNSVKVINNPTIVFKLDLRVSATTGNGYRNHTGNFRFMNCWIESGRGFATEAPRFTDFDHFIYIDGGWIIRSGFHNISTRPNVSLKSVIHVDLTHVEGGPSEVGVPDAVVMENISCQNAGGATYVITFKGDAVSTGTGSRCGNIRFAGIYGGNSLGYDWSRVKDGSEDLGVIRVENCKLSQVEAEFIFGQEHLFNIIGSLGELANSRIGHLNIEHNADKGTGRGPMLRGLFRRCVFEQISWYSETNKLTRLPQLVDIQAEQCKFVQILMRDLGHGGAALPSDWFNLRAGSYGNTVEMPIKTEINATSWRSYLSDWFTVPFDTRIDWLDRKTAFTNFAERNVAAADLKVVTLATLSTEMLDLASALTGKFGASHVSGSASTWELAVTMGSTPTRTVLGTYTVPSGQKFSLDFSMIPITSTNAWNAFSNRYLFNLHSVIGTTVLSNMYEMIINLNAPCVIDITPTAVTTSYSTTGSMVEHFYLRNYLHQF